METSGTQRAAALVTSWVTWNTQWPLREPRRFCTPDWGRGEWGSWEVGGSAEKISPCNFTQAELLAFVTGGQPVRLTGNFADHTGRVVCVGRQHMPACHLIVPFLGRVGGQGKVETARSLCDLFESWLTEYHPLTTLSTLFKRLESHFPNI